MLNSYLSYLVHRLVKRSSVREEQLLVASPPAPGCSGVVRGAGCWERQFATAPVLGPVGAFPRKSGSKKAKVCSWLVCLFLMGLLVNYWYKIGRCRN